MYTYFSGLLATLTAYILFPYNVHLNITPAQQVIIILTCIMKLVCSHVGLLACVVFPALSFKFGIISHYESKALNLKIQSFTIYVAGFPLPSKVSLWYSHMAKEGGQYISSFFDTK